MSKENCVSNVLDIKLDVLNVWMQPIVTFVFTKISGQVC